MTSEAAHMSLANFRKLVKSRPISTSQRLLIVEQARILIDSLYAHLPHKRAMYGIDPVQQLRLLAARAPAMDDGSFHRELFRVFDALRDMHTTYVAPEPYRGRVLLGFTVERCWGPRQTPHYIVTSSHRPTIPVGAEIIRWNGMPIDAAVRQNAEAEAGGNPDARFARGLESLTLRNAALSPLPVEDRVHVDFITVDEVPGYDQVEWTVEPDVDGLPLDGSEEGIAGGRARRIGVSLRIELNRRLKYERLRKPPAPGTLSTSLDGEIAARIVSNQYGSFGHLRLYTFQTATGDVAKFLEEVARLLAAMPSEGLILDVRGNGGGYIEAAEGLLALLIDPPITPEPMQFLNSALSYGLCGQADDLLRWRPSIAESAETGEQHSVGFPLSRPKQARAYTGPVILVTDALSYSATDMLAAGFQDHRIGPVLGVDDRTGAGGGNVWSHALLRRTWPDGPFRQLPRDARLTVAARRSLRVRRQQGRPLEDFGVRADVRYRMTREDLLDRNVNLLERAGQVLAEAG